MSRRHCTGDFAFVLREIERALERPSRQELLEAIRSQPEAELGPSPAELFREERDRP